MPKGRGATARYKAMLDDVQRRVSFAMYTKALTNPYSVEDKRHARFARNLSHAQRMAWTFDEMCEVMGDDKSRYHLRHHPDPGPVLTLEVLGERWVKANG